MTNMLLTKLRPASALLVIGAVIAVAATGYRGEAAPEKPGAGKPEPAKAEREKPIDETLADPILFHPRVWLELKLSAEQRDEIDRLLDAEEVQQSELLKSAFLANAPINPRAAGPAGMAAVERAAAARMRATKLPGETALAIQSKVLKPDQARRLRQITLQAKGPSAFQRDDVRAALQYSPEQEKALAEKVDEAWDRIRTGGTDTAAEAYTAAMTKLLDGLTKDQRKAWEDLTGKLFSMPEIVVRKMLNQHAVAAAPLFAPPGGIIPAAPVAPGGFAPGVLPAAPPPRQPPVGGGQPMPPKQ